MTYNDPKQLLAAIVCRWSKSCNFENHDLIAKYEEYKQTKDKWLLTLVFAKCVKGYIHQSRMRWCDVAKVVLLLLKSGFIIYDTYKNFEELYEVIKKLVENIRFAQGVLTVYDTALNIGQLCSYKVQPKEYVYLANCTQKVYKIIYPDARVENHRVKHADIKQDFGGLSSVEIENLLCIFHKLFEKIAVGVTDKEIDEVFKRRMKYKNIDWKAVDKKLEPYKDILLPVAENASFCKPTNKK